MAPVSWDVLARDKRAALVASIPPLWRLQHIPSPNEYPNVIDWPRQVLTDDEILFTESPPVAILANIHARVWTAEEVTWAFCHRAAVAQQLVNCLTEVLFDQAMVAARDLDQYQRDTGCLKGPLHGLPMSFMDRFRIAEVETTAGFVSWIGPKENADAEGLLVKHMRRLGAIPICKTNVPQSMMLGNTTNNIFGSSMNPYNRVLSAGGAAGGEGALVAMKGSPFGWATEIAGSTRIPAAFNGLFALKTSMGRLPTLGLASSNTNMPLCNATVGMLCLHLPSLQHISRLTLGSSAYEEDPAWLDMPWRESKFLKFQRQRRPIFAIMSDDGYVYPQPPLRRALNHAAERLSHRGYEVIDWKPPSHAKAVETLFRMIGADDARDIRHHIQSSGEPPVQQLKNWYVESEGTQSLTTCEYWDLCKSRTDYIASYHSYWKSSKNFTSDGTPVDGVIMPVAAHSACSENDLSYFGYSAIVNHLDFTSVAFPVTFVDQALDARSSKLGTLNATDAQIQTSYNPKTQHGMPVGLQIMCRRVEEEIALTLAEIVIKACGGAGDRIH